MLQGLARALLRGAGWQPVGGAPEAERAVVIAAPHTSNWDGFWLIAYKIAFDIEVRFFAKHTLFWWPLGPLLRHLGAIPVERNRPAANVARLVDMFATRQPLLLALAPEGTRRYKPYWRTGFYRIALAANVPLVLAFIDYGSRRLGIGRELALTGDVDRTLAEIRAFYAGCRPARPERMGPIAFPPG